MSSSPTQRIDELGINLPPASPTAGAYVATTTVNDLVFTSGQIAIDAEKNLVAAGKVGADVDLEQATACARQCAINVLAQLAAELGSLDQVARVVKLTVFVASAPGFTGQPTVGNGASELINAVFGEAGAHSRSAVGVAALPLDSPVEVEAIVQRRP